MIATIITCTSIFSPLVPIWTGRRKRELLWWYACASLISDISFFGLAILYSDKAYWVYNLFLPIEFILVTLFFRRRILARSSQRMQDLLISAVAMYVIADTFHRSFLSFNYFGAAFIYGSFILCAILGLYKVIREIEFVNIERSPLFIFSVAFLIVASGSFIILLFEADLIQTHKDLVKNLWVMLHNPLNIMQSLLIGYGLKLTDKH